MKSLEVMKEYFPVLLKALPMTFYLLFASVFISVVLALLLTWARISRHRVINMIAGIYVSFMRGTPMMVQLLIIFIFIPMLFRELGISTSSWNNSVYAVIAFSLNMAAFFCEIFRSAYLSIERGQIEAAESLGMNSIQTFFRVILPQAAASALPNTTNMTIELMKNTSIAMAIGVYDIMGKGVQLAKNNYGIGQKEIFILIAVMFWIIGLIFLVLSNYVTGKLNKGNPNYKKKKLFAG